jgi:phosphoenolpyruvate carboxykinase (ATP)
MKTLQPSNIHLYKNAIQSGKYDLTDRGALVAYSGKYTGRKPDWKRIVKDKNTENICWDFNNSCTLDEFIKAKEKAVHHLKENTSKELYEIHTTINWNKKYECKIRLYTNNPYHALFFKNMTIPSEKNHEEDEIEFTIYDSGDIFHHDEEGFVGLNLTSNEFVILGTEYAGEIKKGLLTYMMYKMPLMDCLPLHSSANIGKNNDVTLFFGLSGTGKTTLSTEQTRTMIGDDEHVWTPDGVFNVEGGCYAKCKDLSKQNEPEIYDAIRFGAVLENIVMDENNNVDFNDVSITENTRCSYPLQHLDNVLIPATTPHHPQNIILLCCDAFGLLPPIAQLTEEQAVFFFVNGYTSKIAGTEQGVKEPEVTFSSCFGEPFLVHHPQLYGSLLKDYVSKYNCNIWFLNTGWIGGDYKTGKRISIKYSRAIIDAIHDKSILEEEYFEYPLFKFKVPKKCSTIPENILNPSLEGGEEYNNNLQNLFDKFNSNYSKHIKTNNSRL